MPRPNPNFVIGMGDMIIMLLDSTRPKHFNIKTLQVSLHVLSFARSEKKECHKKVS
jgi:hypothetical protein